MTYRSKVTRGTLPPRAVDQWHGVKEAHHAPLADDEDGKTALDEEEATMDMLVFVLVLIAMLLTAALGLAVWEGIVWMGEGQ